MLVEKTVLCEEGNLDIYKIFAVLPKKNGVCLQRSTQADFLVNMGEISPLLQEIMDHFHGLWGNLPSGVLAPIALRICPIFGTVYQRGMYL
jgi:hypothetical protein